MLRTVPYIFLFLVLLTAAPVPCGVAAVREYSFQRDSIQDIPSNSSRIPITQANRVLQTKDGYLWIASYDGLLRYDGKLSKVFGPDDGFTAGSVVTLFEDSQDRLWIGSNTGGLVLYTADGFREFTVAHGLPSNTIRVIAEDKQGHIYVATSLGLAVLHPDFSIHTVDLGRHDSNLINSIMVSAHDEIWCVLKNGAVVVLGADGPIRQLEPGHYNGLIVTVAFQAVDGTIYLGTTENQVIILRPGQQERIVESGSNAYINKFYQDDEGRVWLCSDTGVGFFEGSDFVVCRGALLVNSMQDMVQDFEGGLWFASSRLGLLHVIKSKFQNLSDGAQLPPIVTNATLLHDGKLYLGTDSGLFILDGDTRIENELTEFLHGIRIRDMVEDQEGAIWFATYAKHGVVRYDADGGITSFSQSSHGLPSDRVRCVLVAEDGSLFVGTNGGVSVIRDGRIVRNYGEGDGLLNTVILNLHQDEDGRIYCGSDGGGLYVINGDTVQTYTEKDGLLSNIILRVVSDPQSRGIWISCSSGLCFWDETGFRAINSLGAGFSNIFDIRLIGNDTIWLTGGFGLAVTNRSALLSEEKPELRILQRRDGLSSSPTPNSWSFLDEDGTLYVCTNESVLSIDVDAPLRSDAAPRLLIPSVTIDERLVSRPEQVFLPADNTRLTVNFALISFAHPTGNSVRVFLDGFDKDAETLSTDYTTSVGYTNLPGGQYKLRISGWNKEGVQSEELVLHINKQRHVMEMPLVRLLIGLAILGVFMLGAVLYSRYKTKTILQRQQEYRAITEQAIQAIADTIDAKDHYTSGHSQRVADYSVEIGKRLGLDEKELEDLYYTGLLHDIGKMGLEDSILNKPGRLTDDEFAKVKRHVDIGGIILSRITVIKSIASGALYHHERYDGNGYGANLKGEDIPLFARIICVADAYDAMSTTRSYREGMDEEYILSELNAGAGTQFDAEMAHIMVDIIRSEKDEE